MSVIRAAKLIPLVCGALHRDIDPASVGGIKIEVRPAWLVSVVVFHDSKVTRKKIESELLGRQICKAAGIDADNAFRVSGIDIVLHKEGLPVVATHQHGTEALMEIDWSLLSDKQEPQHDAV